MPDVFVQLDVNYADDDKILSVSALAELAYIRSLCLAKRVQSDGFIHRRQVTRLCEGWDEPEDVVIAELLSVGLWEDDRERNGYVIAAWERHNLTRDEIAKLREKSSKGGTMGNHLRWHRTNPSPDCKHCQPPESGSVGGTDGPQSQEREGETEGKQEGQFSDGFQQFWDVYPTSKGGRAGALTCWKARRREGIAADDMVDAAVNYADHCRDKETDDAFIMQGKTFLGPNLRYEEYLHRPAYVPAPAIETNDHVAPPEMQFCVDCNEYKPDCKCGQTLHAITEKARTA